MNSIPVTVGMLAYNSEENLGRALESLKGFAEIIIADGGSTDRTLEIAQAHGARVISQSNPGHAISDFAGERNRLLEAATQPWFFYLDSDEILTAELQECIATIATDPHETNQAYRVRYLKTNADGSRAYRTYREYYQIRLVRTDIGARFIRPVHERIDLPPGTRVGQIEAPWYVPLDAHDMAFRTILPKAWERTRMEALEWHPKGPIDVFMRVIGIPFTRIVKSLFKMVAVKVRFGKDAVPLKYEVVRVFYSLFLSVQSFLSLFASRTTLRG